MESSATLQQRIIDFLKTLPNLDDVRSRQAFIYSAGLDAELREQISFDIPPSQFVPLLVFKLFEYGTLNTGKQAIQAVLETAMGYIGKDKRVSCRKLLQELCCSNTFQDPLQKQEDINHLMQEQYERLNKHLQQLKMDKLAETDTLRRFKLKKQIETLEVELEQIVPS